VLTRTRYLLLRSPSTLTAGQMRQLDELLRLPLKTGRDYKWMAKFDELYRIEDPDHAERFLRRWTRGVKRSCLPPLIDFARMIEDHWPGVVRWWTSRISNGLLEGPSYFAESTLTSLAPGTAARSSATRSSSRRSCRGPRRRHSRRQAPQRRQDGRKPATHAAIVGAW
jgi:hypothetical protein